MLLLDSALDRGVLSASCTSHFSSLGNSHRHLLDRGQWWAPEPVRMLWSREIPVTLAGNQTPAVQPVAFTITTELSRVLIIWNSSECCCLPHTNVFIPFLGIFCCQLPAPFLTKDDECIRWSPNFSNSVRRWHHQWFAPLVQLKKKNTTVRQW
jgi:hypothetical protein